MSNKRKKNSDLDISAKDIAFLSDIIRLNKDDLDSPLIRLAQIILKLARKDL